MVWIVVCLVLVTNDVREPGCNELFLRVDLCCFDENNHFLTEIEAVSTEKFLVIRFSVYENDAADVISHENQLQHLSEPSIFMLDVFRTADHAGQIFIPHRRQRKHDRQSAYSTSAYGDRFSQVIVDVAPTRRILSRCSNRAGTREGLC